jgi:type II secretory pathway component GspD/PulD (secretin)
VPLNIQRDKPQWKSALFEANHRLIAALTIWGMSAVSVHAQESAPAAANAAAEANVKLTFPDQMDLNLLIDYVSQRLGIKILYDEQVANKQITIKAPGEIPAASLLNVLESALKIKGLALVDGDVPGWKQIVAVKDLSQIAQPNTEALGGVENSEAVTQAFTLKFVTPDKLATIVKPFLTEPGANTITIPEQNLLIITDYAGNLKRIARLVETIDQAGPPSELSFYTVKNLEAGGLAQQIREALTAKFKTQTAPLVYEVTHDERTNQLLIVAPKDVVDQILKLAETLDVPLGVATVVYSFQFVAADRIDKLVKELFDPLTINRLYRSAVDGDDNMLIVTAPPQVHERVEWLKQEMDVESKRPGSSVQFYKLKNASAEEVLATLLSVQQSVSGGFSPSAPRSGPRGVSSLGRGPTGTAAHSSGQSNREQTVPGPNLPQAPAQVEPTPPPALQADPQPVIAQQAASAEQPATLAFAPDAARVTADPFTNSIIVVGDRNVQEVYRNLIAFLDKKRPQVMIEARVVIVDTSEDFALGVELSGDRNLFHKFYQFTSYGLSTVSPTTGALALNPGRGLNWTLVEPEDADAVLRALATHKRARVLSSPRVLVNDNSTGTLASVSEVPFTSVNASTTVATTSFAGFAEAGTTIEVTPRISEDDHLVLDYAVTLNTFTGSGGAGVPPPRQTDEVRSTVTIPDGHTVVVGGLNRSNLSYEYQGIPLLDKIPILKDLTGMTTKADKRTTTFVFLRPVILRDDKFRDLQYISDKSARCVEECPNIPGSSPMLIK